MPNDIGVQSVAPLYLCEGGSDSLQASVANLGASQIDSFMLVWEVNASTDSAWFYVPLDTLNGTNLNVVNVAFDTVQMQSSSFSIKIWSKWPNGIPDANPTNDTATYTLNPLPRATINDAHICAGDSITLSTGVSNATYLWSMGSIDSIVTIDTTTLVTVTVTDFFGCVTSDTAYISQSMNVSLPDSTTFCEGTDVTINAGVLGSYIWSNGSTDSTLTVNAPGTYTVTVTDQNCVSQDSIYVEEILNPIANFRDSADYITVVFTNTSQNATSYMWDFGDNSTDTVENPTHIYPWTPVDFMCYTAVLTASNSCGSDSVSSVVGVGSYPGYHPGISVYFYDWKVEFHPTGASASSSVFSWEFGDGNISSQRDPIHTYLSSNDYECYTVSLVAEFACGLDSVTRKIAVGNYPASNPCNIVTNIEEMQTETAIEIFPNPSSGIFTMSAQVDSPSEMNVEVMDIRGVVVYSKSFGTVTGDIKKEINLQDVSSGIYFIKTQIGAEYIFEKVVLENGN